MTKNVNKWVYQKITYKALTITLGIYIAQIYKYQMWLQYFEYQNVFPSANNPDNCNEHTKDQCQKIKLRQRDVLHIFEANERLEQESRVVVYNKNK